MTALRKEIYEYVNLMSEEKLLALKPLLHMLSVEPATVLEKLTDDDLTDEERNAFNMAEMEWENGDAVNIEDFLQEQKIDLLPA
ncbi:MAG: hypothetical protein FWC32_05150 [Firmicutes bacterium]|nr:hypothetical protein [Bacillota bacterium]